MKLFEEVDRGARERRDEESESRRQENDSGRQEPRQEIGVRPNEKAEPMSFGPYFFREPTGPHGEHARSDEESGGGDG